MFDWIKRKRVREEKPTPSQQAAYKSGQEAGEAIFRAVEGYLDKRLPEVSSRFLRVLRERLETIHNEPGVDPKKVAQIEYDIFVENTTDYPAKMTKEVESGLREWLGLAREIGVGDIVDQHIQRKIVEASASLRLDGALALSEAVTKLQTDADGRGT